MAALAIEFPQVVWSIEFGGDETVVRQVTMTGGGGAGGGGVTVHNDLTGRSDPDTHPISSITGLSAALAAAGNVDSVNGQTGTVSLDLDDLTDVDTTTDPPDADDVLAWDGVTWTPATLTALGAPGLSNATPADLGTAAPGVSTEASRADHVHDMPTAADIAVDASGFNGNLTTSDDTVQEVAQKLDDLVIPAAGIADPGGANDDFLQRKAGAWANRTIAQVKTDLGVIEKLPRTSGEYYTLGGAEAASSTAGSGAAGRMVAHPVWLPAGSYDRACVRTLFAAVATYRIGVYPNDAATMRPDGTTLILDCGTIDMNATAGLLSATVTLSIPTSGIYWLAILMDSYTAAPTVFGWNGNAGVTPNLPYLGHRSISNVGGRGTWGALKTGVTTGSMPGTFPTSTAATDIMPQILVRAT